MKKLLLLVFLTPNVLFAMPPCLDSDCLGSYTFPDGTKYEGEWKDDKKHGQGTYIYSDGIKWVGGFKDDKLYGQGIYVYPDGLKESGEWRNGKFSAN